MSEQTGYKSRMLPAVMVVFTLWASTAIAGVNEDLWQAAQRGDLPAVKTFIANGANVNARYYKGFTSLIFASMSCRPRGRTGAVR